MAVHLERLNIVQYGDGMRPSAFNRLVERIRMRFESEPNANTSVTTLQHTGVPPEVVADRSRSVGQCLLIVKVARVLVVLDSSRVCLCVHGMSGDVERSAFLHEVS